MVRLCRALSFPFDDVQRIAANCQDPATETTWGVSVEGRVTYWHIERGLRDTSGWSKSRVCFLQDAQREAWIRRLEELDFQDKWTLRWFPSMKGFREGEWQKQPANCALGMSSRGGNYGVSWTQIQPASEEIQRFHGELMSMVWPGKPTFEPAQLPKPASGPPIDCEGNSLPGYEDEAHLDDTRGDSAEP